MKVFVLLSLFILSLPLFASEKDVREYVRMTNGSVYGPAPKGYKVVKLDSISIRGGLQTFLRETTKEKTAVWKKFVFTSGEYDDQSAAEKKRIAANPLKFLDVPALLTVDNEELYAIYKGNRLIGYYVQVQDHVQAAIYQDGAWYEIFFDKEINLVELFEASA